MILMTERRRQLLLLLAGSAFVGLAAISNSIWPLVGLLSRCAFVGANKVSSFQTTANVPDFPPARPLFLILRQSRHGPER
jgi:hypothetical protein